MLNPFKMSIACFSSRAVCAAALFFGFITSRGDAAVPNRIIEIAPNAPRISIANTVPTRARLAKHVGIAAQSDVLTSVTLHFSLTDTQQAELTQLLADQQNPASLRFHQWLSPEQYGAQFGISDADMEKVRLWLISQGLSVTYIPSSKNYIVVSGAISQITTAFQTSIHTLDENGVSHISNLSDPVLPFALANVVRSISGLNDFRPRARARVRVVRNSDITPRFTSSISGNHYIAPGDFYTIYNSKPLLSNGTTGTGVKIAIAGQTDISASDVAAFRSAAGLSPNAPTVLTVPGYRAGMVSGDIDEAQLDVEWSGASAPGANIIFVTVGAAQSLSVMDALTYAITNAIAPIISISYGACETDWGQSSLNSYNQYFQQANAQGITIIGPSGDSGATDCDYQESSASQGLAVDFPASSPFVTAAGGSMFSEGSGSYWNNGNDANGSSAKAYIPEAVWNESGLNGLSAGGGGMSVYFTKPAWQLGTGVPNDFARDVPDISFNAAASHDGYLFCSQGSCTNGFRNSNNNLNVVGGTSVSSPVFAGVLALLEQQLGMTSGLGNVNPMIYGLANSSFYGSVFHDIVTGNNNSPCSLGTKDCPAGGSIGYSAGVGYDRATGWGSMDVYNLAANWRQVSPAGKNSSIGSKLSTTTIASSTPTCSVSAGNITLTIKVSGGSSSLIPTGSVQILVDDTALSDPASTLILDASGSAKYTLNTSSLSGAHTVTAIYSGDATFSGSKSNTAADFVASSSDFAITPCTSALTVKTGASGTTTFSVVPFGGFTGTVSLTAVAVESPAITLLLSPATTTISSTGASTITLTVKASQSTTGAIAGYSRMPWYSAGSETLFACTLMVVVRRRRHLAMLMAFAVSIAMLTSTGCGGSSSGTSSNSGTGTGTNTTTTNASVGTYIVNLSGTSAGRVHSTALTLTITN